jgi:hypothetical protein
MRKIILILAPVLFTVLALSCFETNFTEDGHYGKVVVHNDATSARTITRIVIASDTTNHYNERVSIAPGKSSSEYKLELWRMYDILFNDYRVTVTLDDNSTKSKTVNAFEDIVNKLYYDGTDLVERK